MERPRNRSLDQCFTPEATRETAVPRNAGYLFLISNRIV
jgi:hypothetical protein